MDVFVADLSSCSEVPRLADEVLQIEVASQLTSLLNQASEGDTYHRNEMVTLLSSLDQQQRRILLELAATASTVLHSGRQPETGHQD